MLQFIGSLISIIAIVALIKGKWLKLKIPNRKIAAFILVVGIVIAGISGSPTTTPAQGTAPQVATQETTKVNNQAINDAALKDLKQFMGLGTADVADASIKDVSIKDEKLYGNDVAEKHYIDVTVKTNLYFKDSNDETAKEIQNVVRVWNEDYTNVNVILVNIESSTGEQWHF